jgi:purine/pyrimidine-nucleoside phosphorylase
MIKQNEYFDGNVRSLGYTSAIGNSTVGVMEAGEYTFNTGSAEVMTVIEGSMEVQLKDETEWKTYVAGEHYHVGANTSFKVKVLVQTSYLCQF